MRKRWNQSKWLLKTEFGFRLLVPGKSVSGKAIAQQSAPRIVRWGGQLMLSEMTRYTQIMYFLAKRGGALRCMATNTVEGVLIH